MTITARHPHPIQAIPVCACVACSDCLYPIMLHCKNTMREVMVHTAVLYCLLRLKEMGITKRLHAGEWEKAASFTKKKKKKKLI